MYSLERNEKEIKNAIKDQLIYIKNSCNLFDAGCQAEAIRIATAISVLLENTKKSTGILKRVNYNFELLSTVPDVEQIELDRLIVIKKQNIDEAIEEIQKLKNDIKSDNKILLIYILNFNEWYLFAFDNGGNEISYPISDLAKHLNLASHVPLVDKWINTYTDDCQNINPIGKRIAITHLSALLNHDVKYVSGLYFPMIKTIHDKDHPTLSDSNKKYIDIDQWLNEIIFCIIDEKREQYILKRNDLIKTARDQDGGGHFDLKLKVISYYKSKIGEKIAEKNGKDITTENFHLIMLRQLGFEILNSPSIIEHIGNFS